MELKTRNDFQNILKQNPGLIFIKLGARGANLVKLYRLL